MHASRSSGSVWSVAIVMGAIEYSLPLVPLLVSEVVVPLARVAVGRIEIGIIATIASSGNSPLSRR